MLRRKSQVNLEDLRLRAQPKDCGRQIRILTVHARRRNQLRLQAAAVLLTTREFHCRIR